MLVVCYFYFGLPRTKSELLFSLPGSNRCPFIESVRKCRTRSRFTHRKAFFFVGHIRTMARATNGAQILGKDVRSLMEYRWPCR